MTRAPGHGGCRPDWPFAPQAQMEPGEAHSRVLDIVNVRGLHARASAKFVQTATAFDAVVTVEKDGNVVDGTSILDLMMLAAAPGCRITVTTAGPQSREALDALAALVADRFHEEA